MNKQNKIKNTKNPVIGITHGDINGIGYEVIIKALMDNRINEMLTPIIYGSSKVASYHRKALGISDFNINLIKDSEKANPKRVNIINCSNDQINVDLGISTDVAGEMAYKALEMAIADMQNNTIDVLVTAPINKKNIQSGEFDFPGHTEYLAQRCESDSYLMLMISEGLRIAVATGHIPLADVSQHLTEELLTDKINIMNDTLKVDFSIQKPRIAVLGLNPHAGDGGLLGSEDETVIAPAVKKAFDNDIMAFGPYPADGFFGSSNYKKFDGILAMYHDQGLIPFKSLSFDNGVNFTAGLPIIRTSPAHGTAYELAGKNISSPNSFRQALYLACDIYHNRKENLKLMSGPLKKSDAEEENRP